MLSNPLLAISIFQVFIMIIYTEEALYALSLSQLVQLCEDRQVAPLSSNPRWKKSYVPALLTAQEAYEASILPEPSMSTVAPIEDATVPLEPCPWEDGTAENDAVALVVALPLVKEEQEEEAVLSPNAVVVYPVVFLLLLTWVVLQVAIGVVSVVVFCLKQIAQKTDEQATKRLEMFRTPSSLPMPITA